MIMPETEQECLQSWDIQLLLWICSVMEKLQHILKMHKNLLQLSYSNIETGEKRFMAAYNFLEEQATVDPNNIAAIGYCFGGGVVLHMASIGTDLKAVASFHGGLQAVVSSKGRSCQSFHSCLQWSR